MLAGLEGIVCGWLLDGRIGSKDFPHARRSRKPVGFESARCQVKAGTMHVFPNLAWLTGFFFFPPDILGACVGLSAHRVPSGCGPF